MDIPESAQAGSHTVSVVVMDAAQRLLMFPTAAPDRAMWSFPSGDLKPGEEPTAAARRVVETATAQGVSQVVGPIAPQRTSDQPRTGLFFLCRAEAFYVQPGNPRLTTAQGQWWPLEKLPATAGALPLADLVALIKHHL